MPETRRDVDLVVAGARALLLGGIVCSVAALIAYATGDVIDAVWVLGTLGVALVAAAYALAHDQLR